MTEGGGRVSRIFAAPTRLCRWLALIEYGVNLTQPLCEWMIQVARDRTLSLAWEVASLLTLSSSEVGLEGVGTIWPSSYSSEESSRNGAEQGRQLSIEDPFQGQNCPSHPAAALPLPMRGESQATSCQVQKGADGAPGYDVTTLGGDSTSKSTKGLKEKG
ncbi:LOW QUALITY PROTEIN: saitohin [Hylobates moloch]|uniref:LOW QUALITY PROTEIN: saitohin n=1 Tax=Hylobates moloch TaxID=81572 RepID=UPI0026762B1B|nr:LOW QUALITY PROTEIN: saitohin [Hylobates moloch]